MDRDAETRAAQPFVGGEHDRAFSFSASAAGAGVVMASRPKNGAGDAFIGFLVHQHVDRLAAAQQGEDALARRYAC